MSDHKLDTCGCCEGENRLTPIDTYNRPGLDALAFRVGTHAAFFETMIAALAREEITLETVGADGQPAESKIHPLQALKTRRRDDFSIALLDAWATIADVLTFYQERIANEGYLRTATERQSILELARLVGYELRPGVAASTYLSFTVEKAEKPALISKGTRAQSIPAPGETMQSFETMHDLEARYEYNELKLRLAQPQFLKESALPLALYLPGLRSDLRQSDRLLLAFGVASARVFKFDGEARYYLAQVKNANLLDQPARTAVGLQPEPKEIHNPHSVAMRIEGFEHTYSRAKMYYLQEAWNTRTVINAIKKVGMLPSVSPENVTRDASNQDVGFQGAAALNAQLAENIYATMGQEVAPLEDDIPALRALVLLRLQAHLHGHDAPWKGQTQETGDRTRVFETILSEWPDLASELAKEPSNIQKLAEELKSLVQQLPSDQQAWASKWSDIQTLAQELKGLVQRLPSDQQVWASKWLGELWELTDGIKSYIDEWERLFDGTTITLDRVYEEIRLESLIILEWQNNTSPQLALFQVTGADTVSTSLFNKPTTATRLTLKKIKGPDWNPASMAIIRSTTVYAGSELVSNPVPFRILAEEPAIDVVGQITYIVKEGDTLTDIAQSHNVTEAALAEANNIVNSTLPPTLIIPPGAAGQVTYVVKEGDKLTSIAQSHNVTGAALAEANNIVNNTLPPTLIIPLELELDGIYADLQPGHGIAITGMRTDIPVTGREVTLIKAVRHGFAQVIIENPEPPHYINLPGDLRHTFVTLATPLSLSYQRATVTMNANVVPATHGETARGVPPNERDVILGSGDGAQAHQRFELKLPPGKRLTYLSAPTRDGVESMLEVYVNDVLWQPVRTLIDAKPTDHVYTVQTEDDGKTDVVFGDGLEGARPPTGRENVYARYRVGIGKAGNVKAEQISLLATRPAGVKEVINSVAATGGTDPESRDQARRSVKFSVRTLDRLVGLQDYEDFARTFAGIGKARAQEVAAGITVWVAGEDSTSLQADCAVLDNLKKALDLYDGSNVAIEVKLYAPLLITLEATVWISPDYLWEKVQPAIEAALHETFGFAQRDLGQVVALSEVIAVIQRVPGVVHVQVTRFDALTEKELRDQASGNGDTQDNKEALRSVLDAGYFADKLAETPEIPFEAVLAFIDPAVPSLIALGQPESGEKVP